MKTASRILMTYLVLSLLFTGAMVAAFCIPTAAIEENVRQSVQQVADGDKGFSPRVGLIEPLKLGTFSDCLILGIAYCADTRQPLYAAMSDTFVMKDGSPIAGARQMTVTPPDPGLQPVVYSRYWHGNQTIVRPLLCVTTVGGIRVANVVLLSLLLIALLAVMWRRAGRCDALIVTLSLAAVMFPSVPLCLNYVPTFYIALVSSLVIVLWPRATSKRENTIVLFFIIGALTTFLDLLTTPMVAMAVPLVVYILCRRPAKPLRAVIVLSLAWLLGYASLWATKWLLAAVITGHAALSDAMGAVTQRTVGHDEQDYMLWCLKRTGAMFLATGLLTAALTLLLGKSRQAIRANAWMLLVALSSYVWAFVLLEHTWHHLHFTWRTFVVLVMGIALFMRHTLSLRQPLGLKE